MSVRFKTPSSCPEKYPDTQKNMETVLVAETEKSNIYLRDTTFLICQFTKVYENMQIAIVVHMLWSFIER